MRTRNSSKRSAPRHFNPPPMFGLRRHKCRNCGLELEPEDNQIVHLGGGACAKFGLCTFCLDEEMYERERWDAEMEAQREERDLHEAIMRAPWNISGDETE